MHAGGDYGVLKNGWVIRLATPTTDAARLPRVLGHSSGFLYYVAIAGITGTKSAVATDTERAVARIRAATQLPIAVGFGIRSAEQAAEIARFADAAVVGSALVATVAANLDASGKPRADLVDKMLAFTADLAKGVRTARATAKAAI